MRDTLRKQTTLEQQIVRRNDYLGFEDVQTDLIGQREFTASFPLEFKLQRHVAYGNASR